MQGDDPLKAQTTDTLTEPEECHASAARSLPTLTLVHASDPDRLGERAYLGPAVRTLGREAKAFPGGPLPDTRVSRAHAEVVAEADGGFRVRDLGSKNGTFVNGTRVDADGRVLSDGDLLRVGDTCVLFHRTRFPRPPVSELPGIIGFSDAARVMRAEVCRYAAKTAPVLVLGESGTGKELVANAVARLGRPGRPVVVFNAGAVSTTLVDSVLFGHVRGAFTDAKEDRPGLFRAADAGTLFLDEIGELPLQSQVRLLRVVEDGRVLPVGAAKETRVDVRLVSATARDLEAEVEAGRFRGDLYARLAALVIRVPPLRERREDIPLLVLGLSGGRPLAADAVGPLLAHPWPYNVRELRTVVAQAMADAGEEGPVRLSPAVLDRLARHREKFAGVAESEPEPSGREALEAALTRHRGNVARAAADLGKDRGQFYRMMKAAGLEPERFR
jgi:DNA-binding NtrC family response regulator